MKNILNTKNIARIAIMGALGGVLMSLDFPIGVAPSFYKLDLGNVPCLIGSFAMGPIQGVLTILVKILVKLVIKGTSTSLVGELADFIISGSYCFFAGVMYVKNKTKKGAIKAMIVSSVCMVILATIANYYVIIPCYVAILDFPLEDIIAAGSQIFPIISTKLGFCLICVALFNCVKVLVSDVLTMFLYKYISPLLKDN